MKTKQAISLALVNFVALCSFVVTYGCWQKEKSPKKQESTATTGEAKGQLYSVVEAEKHNQPTIRWLVISGKVYDISQYIKQHPTAPEIVTPYCGQDATKAYATKGGKGRKHSPHADRLLQGFMIGELN